MKKEARKWREGANGLGVFHGRTNCWSPLTVPEAAIPFRISWGPGWVIEDIRAFCGVGLRKSGD